MLPTMPRRASAGGWPRNATHFSASSGFFVRQKANGDQLAAIAGLVVKGTVKVNVETVLPLPEARQAQELSKTGHSGGKIVLEVNGR